MLTPGRLLIHDNNWKKLEFLTMFENNNNNNSKGKAQQAIKSAPPVSNKIDFNKLFDEKLQKYLNFCYA
jgi:hypothetical protein